MSESPRLPPGQQLAAPGVWPTVGERAPSAAAGWTGVSVEGLVARPRRWSFDELSALGSCETTVDLHCVTRWSKLGVRFRGASLAELLSRCEPLPEARFVVFTAHSDRGHSTSLPLDEALALGTLAAWQADGEPLSTQRGGPVRIVVPGRYFYKSLKWVARIELLADDRLGYWEGAAGYHNHADPWLEQRFVAARVDRRELARRLASRDFAGAEMLGLDLSGRDLVGFSARDALLRNADFRGADLTDADFRRANLSNARFATATLRGARFDDADLEGADFAGADLRGADLRGASLFGATFVDGNASDESPCTTRVDETTRIGRAALEALAPRQIEFLRRHVQPE